MLDQLGIARPQSPLDEIRGSGHTQSTSARRTLAGRRDCLVIRHGNCSRRSRPEAGSASPIAAFTFWRLTSCAHSSIPEKLTASVF